MFRSALFILALAFQPTVANGSDEEEREISDTMVRQMAGFVSIALEEMDPQRPGVRLKEGQHTHDPDPCYPMAYLYKTPHSLNPYYGKKEIRDKAIAIVDRIAATRMRPEWPLYLTCQVYALLKKDVAAEKRRAWELYAEDYVRTEGNRPFFRTSPNHEALNALAIFRAGQVFDRAPWVEHGRRLMHRLLKRQTELGYFDEGRGPSMKYNQIQLAALLLFHDYSQDDATLQAARKLADFMIRYSFPDGSPIGTFDGRQSYSLGYFGTLCYGMDRWPLGKELNRRIFRTRKNRGVLDPSSPYYSFSDWYAYVGSFFLVDELLSLRHDAPAVPLPQDRDGYRMVESGPSFSGGVIRRHNWMVALSAIDLAPATKSIYQKERQSRLDVWHQTTGLIIGGGHNQIGEEAPLANIVLVGPDQNADADFGLVRGADDVARRAVYFPNFVKATLDPDRQLLEESFEHGVVSFQVEPRSDTRLEIGFACDVFRGKKLFVQLPLVVFEGNRLQIDGRDFSGTGPVRLNREIRIQDPIMASEALLVLPQGREALLRYPILPSRWYVEEKAPQRYRPYYRVALVSVKIDPPEGRSEGRFVLEIRSWKPATRPPAPSVTAESSARPRK